MKQVKLVGVSSDCLALCFYPEHCPNWQGEESRQSLAEPVTPEEDSGDKMRQEELKDYLRKLYERYVPQATREYLDDRIAREENARPSRPNRQRNADRQAEERSSV